MRHLFHVLSIMLLTFVQGSLCYTTIYAKAFLGASNITHLTLDNILDESATGYWAVPSSKGFMPVIKGHSFVSPHSDHYRDLIGPNIPVESRTMANILKFIASAPNLTNDMINSMTESAIEDLYHTYAFVIGCLARRFTEDTAESDRSPIHIPSKISEPFLHISRILRRYPGLGYVSLTLDNCERLSEPPHFFSQRLLTGMKIEDGFYVTHCEQEDVLSSAISSSFSILRFSLNSDIRQLTLDMHVIADSIRQGVISLKHMHRLVDPHEYYHDLRHYFKYDASNRGLLFDSQIPSQSVFIPDIPGPTGAQTSSIPFIDAVFGVTLSHEHLKHYMNLYRGFWPYQHRRLIEWVETNIDLRSYLIATGDILSIKAFDDVLSALAEWRIAHIIHTETFISRQAGAGDAIGTGGSTFHEFLCHHIKETLSFRIDLQSSTSLAHADICLRYWNQETSIILID